MPKKSPPDAGPRITIEIPARARVVIVGRTTEDCASLVAFLKPWVQMKGGSLRVFSQAHQMEELAGEKIDGLVLDMSLGSNARDTVEWMVRRGNGSVIVYSFSK